jgi:ketosteroid isomerase-like protein
MSAGATSSDVVRPSDRVRAIFAAFDAKDVPALAAFMTDDVRLRLGNAEMISGKPAFVEAVSAFFGSVARFRHQVVNVWSDGDALIAELDVHHTRLDGRGVTVPCCNVFRLRDGFDRGLPHLHRQHSRVRVMTDEGSRRVAVVTGGAGATGGAITARLAPDHTVVVLDRTGDVVVDLRDPDDVRRAADLRKGQDLWIGVSRDMLIATL